MQAKRGAEGEAERISSRLPTECGVPSMAQSREPEIMTPEIKIPMCLTD